MVRCSRCVQLIIVFQPYIPLAFSFECARKTGRAVVKHQSIITMSSSSVDKLANKEDDIPQLQTSVKSDTHQLFGRFRISSNQIFHRTIHSFALVNLRPIVPGHVLVCSNRVTPVLSDLLDEEYDDLWKSVRIVQQVLKHQYNCDAFNISVQDGKGAGQSVPHVHVHILPRYVGDFERNDDIYDQLEEWAPRGTNTSGKKSKLDVPEDSERKERTVEEMAEEAALYKSIISRLST
jgi:bis(5'-adenosyl)-triphosphatase